MKAAFGNDNGSGEAQDVLSNLPELAPDALNTRVAAFYTALATLFAASTGDVYITATDELTPNKPGAGVNIDEVLLVDWTPDGTGRPRKLTIQGCTPDATNSQQEDAGLRLNAAGANVIRGALNGVYGVSSVTVARGKFIRKA